MDKKEETLLLLVDKDDFNRCSHRNFQINRGVSRILTRWPTHVCRSMWYITALLLIVISLSLSLFLIGCLVSKNVDQLSSYDIQQLTDPGTCPKPLDLDFEERYPQRMFFVSVDKHQADKLPCTVESTARLKNNFTCFIINLFHKQPHGYHKLAFAYPRVKVISLEGSRFFRTSPIDSLWRKCQDNPVLLEFAARVLMLWNHGGSAHSFDLLARNSSGFQTPVGDNITVEMSNGSVIISNTPCHAFLFDVMKSLSNLSADGCKSSVEHVLKDAKMKFCNTSRCDGISFVPKFSVCSADSSNGTNECKWMRNGDFNASALHNWCPLMYSSHSSHPFSFK